MIEVSSPVRLKEVTINHSEKKVVARYPAAIGGMKLSDLPHPHGYLFLDRQNGSSDTVEIYNEFGRFTLKGACSY